MGGKINDLKPGYDSQINELNKERQEMVNKLLKMASDLGKMTKEDLIFLRRDVIIDLGKEVKKAWENWDSIKHPENYG